MDNMKLIETLIDLAKVEHDFDNELSVTECMEIAKEYLIEQGLLK